MARSILVLATTLALLASAPVAAETVLPPPATDAAAGKGQQTAVLAGGCFWGVEAVFEHVRGVTKVVSGYAGGEAGTARYERVGTGTTGHAEAVRITYDPARISYGKLLQVYFAVAHDPTQVDRQGPDYGPQYRSAIFADGEQAKVARAYIAELDAAHTFDAPIATRLEGARPFYPAEAYHQDFMRRNPTHPYILAHDAPKLEALRRLFPDLYR